MMTIAAAGQGVPETVVWIIGIGTVGLVTLMWVIISHATNANRRREIEISRRELAAYVAEGSISPEDAKALLTANPPPDYACGRDTKADKVERAKPERPMPA